MAPVSPAPQELLPHAPPMVLLDTILDWSETMVSAELTVRPETPFFELGLGVPAHIGIEWMAQTCGLFAGLEAKAAGRPVRLGFLLGTRRFQAERGWFVDGDRPRISAKLFFREEGMAVFDCAIDVAGVSAAKAQLTLYQPADEASFLSDQSGEQRFGE
jgi:predicted hotdog family 3-hydroxylacyl-ACP dehydratase